MSGAELHARASELFLDLRERDRDERAAALAALDDTALRDEVASLLAHDEAPVVTRERIGPYRIIECIGRGGSGQVFLAEQDEPVRRRVAVKVVPQAAVSPELAARFEVERAALELVDHPNVARVLDAGRTPDGLPYLVMDYVEGVPLTAWCEQRAVALRERVHLVIDVAEAVQHVHQRGVIHRDLKPSNVLVAEVDGRPAPRVLDFGISRAVSNEGTPALTAPGLVLGTPAYMAPEQTGGRDVDTRADVYALGALLYELVAGRPPLEMGADPLECIMRVREDVPAPASRSGHLAAPRALLTDLDSILGKALEKSPERRYPTAAAFADDLRRLLRSEPVLARPATMAYRTSRFVRRHRALASGMGLLLLGLVLGLAGLAFGLREARLGQQAALAGQEQARMQTREAEHQQREADLQREAQAEINRFLTDDLLAAASPFHNGVDVTALDLLDQASARVDQRFAERPQIAAAVHHALGRAYTELGAWDRADEHLTAAVALRRAEAGPDAADTIRSEIAAASVLVRRQRSADAVEVWEQLIPRARGVLGAADFDLYTALAEYGVALIELDRNDDAIAALNEALEGQRRLLEGNDPVIAGTLSHLSTAHEQRGEFELAMDMLRRGLAIADAADEPPHMILLELNNNLAVSYQDLNRDAEAVPYLRRAATIADEWLGPSHPATLTIESNLAGLEVALGEPLAAAERYRALTLRRTELFGPEALDTLTARMGYWAALREGKRYDEACAGFEQLVDDMSVTLGESHWLTAQTRASWAHALVGAGRFAEALTQAREARARLAAQFGPDHPRTQSAIMVIDAVSAFVPGG